MKDFIVTLGLVALGLFIVGTLILGSGTTSIKSAGTALNTNQTAKITAADWE